ncbi:hypothetical protein [Brevibacillus sp. HD3.3A]|uniref:hypothetical protein n=1 Tax=Brevibacillus sp. HD3.3A TaxID=2738979 RepID=UPI00156B7942|nr:hypothetical protein [Brevibacillus sp. HD3.3A]UED70739.1 hypothetical protein HP435_08910 [Brevibacillus sp. HD3.3A]
MFKIRVVKSLYTKKGWVHDGEVLDARVLPGGALLEVGRPYQVIAGKFSGEEIPQTHAITIPKEKMYTEKQYTVLSNELQRVRDELKVSKERGAYLEQKIQDADHHIKQWGEAWEELWNTFCVEKRLIREEIDRVGSGNKVVLPREVAEAIEEARREDNRYNGTYSNFSLLDSVNAALRNKWRGISCIEVIAKWVSENMIRRELLIVALVNGYTIQETTQDRIKRGVQDIYENWTTIQSSGDDREDGTDLAERITKFVTEELKL